MIHQRIKQFWINKINTVIIDHAVDPSMLAEGVDWEDKLNALEKWGDIGTYGEAVLRDAYTKGGQAVPNPLLTAADNYGGLLGGAFVDLETEHLDLADFMKTKIGVDPTDDTTVTLLNGSNPLKWKNDINKKLPTPPNPNDQTKLTDIPVNVDLVDLLYNYDLHNEITDAANGLPNLIVGGLAGPDVVNKYGFEWFHRVNNTEVQGYKNYENQIRTACGLDPTDLIPNNWETDVNLIFQYFINSLGLTNANNLPTIPAGENLASLLTKSGEYRRINTKLNGKVSDNDLDALLNNSPNCSHSDYDAIKSERDALKTENTQLKENHEKLVSELGLAKDSDWQAVLAKVKELMKTPDATEITELKQQKTQLETQLKDKEKTIVDLQQQKPQSEVSQEIKSQIIESSKELGLFSQSYQQKIEGIKSYQELSRVQNEMFKEKLLEKENSLQEIKDNTEKIKISLIVLVVIFGLLILGGIGYYLKKKPAKNIKDK